MSSGYQATTNSETQRYQGYPYVNPPAFGVPSIDHHTASRWANLPRRPIGVAVRVEEPGSSGTQQIQESARSPDESMSYKSDDEPVLYIDLPAEDESDLYVRNEDSPTQANPRLNQPKQRDKDDEEPMVYIDMPEEGGSEVSERLPEVDDGPSTSVVQETILYDQFKNRIIDISPVESAGSSNNTPSQRPPPPTSLSLWSPGNAEPIQHQPTPRPSPYLPDYLSPEQYRRALQRTPEEEFQLPPLPVTEHPEPPPAYAEVDPGNPAPAEQTATTDPPRTTVILHGTPTDSNRKVLLCSHCQETVNSLVVRQTTTATHLIACCCFSFGMIPCIFAVYFCDVCKPKVHYCPNCNEKITSEFPIKLCKDL